jgi:multimeric flavodoxin WrbA
MGNADKPPLVVAVVGSPRATGNTSVLVDAALAELERRGAAVRKVLLAEHTVGPCAGHEQCGRFTHCPQRDAAKDILDLVYAADGLLLASPVYYENVTAQMKAFMDRNVFRYSHDEWLPARAVGLLAVTAETGLDDALDAMRRYVALSTVSEVPTFTCGVFADGLGPDGQGVVAQQPDALAAARSLAVDLAASLDLR